MSFYPYSKIKSINLRPLLFTARFLGVISLLGFGLTTLLFSYLFFVDGLYAPANAENALFFLKPMVGISPINLVVSLWNSCFWGMIGSGIAAAVVSIEYKFTYEVKVNYRKSL